MRNAKSISNMKTLAARLKIEKFVKEQLWQHVFVVSMIALFAFLLEKEIEAICFCVAHIVIRPKFNKQYHSMKTNICLMITLSIAFFGILLCLPINTSLLFSVPLAFGVVWVGYIAQDRLDLLTPKPFNTDTCTESELIARCKQLHFSDENTALAIDFFIRKTKQSVIADQLCIDEKSVTTRKKRMKQKLNNQ